MVQLINSDAIADIATLMANYHNLEIYVRAAEGRCKERDASAMEKIKELSNEVETLRKKMTTSAIVWATICATIASLFAAAVFIIDKAMEWGRILRGVDK